MAHKWHTTPPCVCSYFDAQICRAIEQVLKVCGSKRMLLVVFDSLEQRCACPFCILLNERKNISERNYFVAHSLIQLSTSQDTDLHSCRVSFDPDTRRQ